MYGYLALMSARMNTVEKVAVGRNNRQLRNVTSSVISRKCQFRNRRLHGECPSPCKECWSEVIIKNGLSPSLVDDPLFRKALVTTARMGQSAVCMGKGTALGKRDTTLTRRDTFSRKIIPATDKRLDEEGMTRLKPRMKKVGGTLMSDG